MLNDARIGIGGTSATHTFVNGGCFFRWALHTVCPLLIEKTCPHRSYLHDQRETSRFEFFHLNKILQNKILPTARRGELLAAHVRRHQGHRFISHTSTSRSRPPACAHYHRLGSLQAEHPPTKQCTQRFTSGLIQSLASIHISPLVPKDPSRPLLGNIRDTSWVGFVDDRFISAALGSSRAEGEM